MCSVVIACFSLSVGPKLKYFENKLKVLLGGSILLTCVVEEGDGPMSFQWTKDGDMENSLSGVDIWQTNIYSSILGISEANSGHTGIYSCTALNSVGVASTTVHLEVIGNV